MRDESDSFILIIFLAISFIGGCNVGYRLGEGSLKQSAVKSGVGKFETDATGSVGFHWTKPDGSVIIQDQTETK